MENPDDQVTYKLQMRLDFEFKEAVRQGDVGRAESALERGANLYAQRFQALLWAAHGKNAEMTRFLLDKDLAVCKKIYNLNQDLNVLHQQISPCGFRAMVKMLKKKHDIQQELKGLLDGIEIDKNEALSLVIGGENGAEIAELLMHAGADLIKAQRLARDKKY